MKLLPVKHICQKCVTQEALVSENEHYTNYWKFCSDNFDSIWDSLLQIEVPACILAYLESTETQGEFAHVIKLKELDHGSLELCPFYLELLLKQPEEDIL